MTPDVDTPPTISASASASASASTTTLEPAKTRVRIYLRPGHDDYVCADFDAPEARGVHTQGETVNDATRAALEAYEAHTGRPLGLDDYEVVQTDPVRIAACVGRRYLARVDAEVRSIVDASAAADALPFTQASRERVAEYLRDAIVPYDGEHVAYHVNIGGRDVGLLRFNPDRSSSRVFCWDAVGCDGNVLASGNGAAAYAAITAQPEYARAVRERLAQIAAAQNEEAKSRAVGRIREQRRFELRAGVTALVLTILALLCFVGPRCGVSAPVADTVDPASDR